MEHPDTHDRADDQRGPTYRGYLALDTLLSLQKPLAAGREPDRVTSAEHFFIVVHQASELWLAQLLLDLDLAADALHTAAPQVAAEHLARAADVFDVLHRHVEVLDRLPGDCFARFRPYLGTASGAQSTQFAALERALGFGPDTAPIMTALDLATTAAGTTLTGACHPESPFRPVVDALLDIARMYWRWKVAHLSCVTRLLGDLSGTGGTTGAHYLASRIRWPFPDLLTARREADFSVPVA